MDAQQIKELKDLLEPRDKIILKRRFIDGKKLREAGEELGLTRERVRQLQNIAMARIRRFLRAENISMGADDNEMRINLEKICEETPAK